MRIIDAILNLAALLLWMNWRALALPPVTHRGGTLTAALRRITPRRQMRWFYLLSLLVLLCVRALFYWHIGSSVDWVAAVDLHILTLSFRSDLPGRIFQYSFLSFGITLGIYYAWLLLISAVNRKLPDTDPWQFLVRQQLGWLEYLPPFLKILLPPLTVAACWIALVPHLEETGLFPEILSTQTIVAQAVTFAVGSILCWKFLLLFLLALHLLDSYVYLGNIRFLEFVSATSQNLLKPLQLFPLQIKRVDLRPIIAIALVLLLSHQLRAALPYLYQLLLQ